MPHRILFFSHSSAMYGAERSMLDLIAALDPEQYQVIVGLPTEGPMADALRADGIEVRVTKHQKWMGGKYFAFAAVYRLLLNLVATLKQWLWIRKNPVDLIYTNTSAIPVGGALALITGTPHLWHVREFVPQGTSGRFYYGQKFSYQFIQKTATQVVANSHQLKNALTDFLSEEKIRVVYNGILKNGTPAHQPRTCPHLSETLRLSTIGSLGTNKGVSDAIQALALLKRQGRSAKLTIVGDGLPEYRAQLEALAHAENVENLIEWTGYLKDPSPVYRETDIVLICSRWESFGRVAVEAGAWGCPAVVTARGGLLEVILDGETGLFYEPGDIEALYDHILALSSNSSFYEELSRQALQSVHKRFTTQTYASEMSCIMQQLLSTPASESRHV